MVSNILDTIILINKLIQELHPHSHNTLLFLRYFNALVLSVFNSWISSSCLSLSAQDIIHQFIHCCPPTLTLAKLPDDSFNLCSVICFAFTSTRTDPVKFI